MDTIDTKSSKMAGLFDLEFHEKKIKEHQPPLAKLDKVINWEMFRKHIEEKSLNNICTPDTFTFIKKQLFYYV